jgi:Asp-tRNA(Asn)/Glu-tRNA(Gln) amidotransferase A subunit family amidase
MNRRRFLTRAAAGATLPLASGKMIAADATPDASGITADSVAAAERLAAVEFTAEQRAPLAKDLASRAAGYREVRRNPLPNSVAPALSLHLRASPDGAASVAPIPPAWIPPETSRPASSEDLAFLPVTALASLLRARKVTSRELTELFLERLRRLDPVLEAVVTLTPERALRQADAADAELRAGKWRGPLHGVPWGAKDLLAVRGYPTTWGARPFREQTFDTDAEVVRRLDAAGAVLVAKLSLGALAYGADWFGGRTKCPWNIALPSSGSSAGSCAAVSAGLVPFAIGSETLGSIVSPCTRNAVTGLRPTYGRVSRAGAMALAWSMDKIGPIARTVEDCALVFAAIHGADPADPTATEASFVWSPTPSLRGRRVGFVEAQFAAESEWRDAHRGALETLRGLGAELVPVEMPKVPGRVVSTILSAEAAAAFSDLTLSGEIDDILAPRPSNWAKSMRESRFIPAVEYIQANRVRTGLIRETEDLFARHRLDAWVTPSFGDQLSLTNATGHPAVCVPAGFAPLKDQPADSPRRNATAITFHAALFADDRALAVAHAFQQATRWHDRRPPVV